MCGVIGLVFAEYRADLGLVASELLRTLEYRGYDSTGAAIQGDEVDVVLRKGVGAPSVMVEELGITKLGGRVLCGQVRWATFGAVDEANAQPHVVRCHEFLYGAHNGNVTNCDDLKSWLRSEGHAVLSDNDGEMVVHTVEHEFALQLAGRSREDRGDPSVRRESMRCAIAKAQDRLRGSYAAVIVDPVTRVLWAVKQGSSLYFGLGGQGDESGGPFSIASSDLSSVLKLTRILVPLSEGQFVEYDPVGYQVYRLVRSGGATGFEAIERTPVRSRLRSKDTTLLPPFETFMDQEISAQEGTCRDVVTLLLGGSERSRALFARIDAANAEQIAALEKGLDALRHEYEDDAIRRAFHEFVDRPGVRDLLGGAGAAAPAGGVDGVPSESLVSSEAGFFTDLLPMARDGIDRSAVHLLDAYVELDEVREYERSVGRFLDLCDDSFARGGRLLVVSCGTSYHAARAAALFFNDVARTELIPVLPGEFRGQYEGSLRDGDLVVAVSQSGETKDLIDVMNDVQASARDVHRVALVNNVNSTLAQEKADVVLALRCGAEIAVPATKSFLNQLTVFYVLSLRVAERRAVPLPAGPERDARLHEIAERRRRLPRLPELIRETVDSTDAEIEEAAKHLFLAPSIQILATRITAVAKEGALKIREVVLNHTEGFEGSEFKHGPNTILGVNTIFGPSEVDLLVKAVGRAIDRLFVAARARGCDDASIRRMSQAITDGVFSPTAAALSLSDEERSIVEESTDRDEILATLVKDYPLIYITGPGDRDVQLTVSQINTHKIRGASTVVIAEDHPDLRQAAEKAPADNPSYRSVYIRLPRTNDVLMTVFSSTVVLQRLALKMSLLKMTYLDRVGIVDHGVHPDVPKNVSKSITVD